MFNFAKFSQLSEFNFAQLSVEEIKNVLTQDVFDMIKFTLPRNTRDGLIIKNFNNIMFLDDSIYYKVDKNLKNIFEHLDHSEFRMFVFAINVINLLHNNEDPYEKFDEHTRYLQSSDSLYYQTMNIICNKYFLKKINKSTTPNKLIVENDNIINIDKKLKFNKSTTPNKQLTQNNNIYTLCTELSNEYMISMYLVDIKGKSYNYYSNNSETYGTFDSLNNLKLELTTRKGAYYIYETSKYIIYIKPTIIQLTYDNKKEIVNKIKEIL